MSVTRPVARRICWPDPDRVCLEGGCGYCQDAPYRRISAIRRDAEARGLLNAYRDGYVNRWWYRVDYR